MMIDPESFYEMELCGKSEEEIKKVITRLKRKINALKRRMEHPSYAPKTYPKEDTQISCYRLYIERARVALEQMGASYEPTASEKRDVEFNKNIPNIRKITLKFQAFSTGWCTVTVEFGEKVGISTDSTSINFPEPCEPEYFEIEKEEFLEYLEELHMGEWLRRYDTKRFGLFVLDGYDWELTVEYNNGKRLFVREGCNSHPYNFEELADVIGVDFSTYLN